MSAPVIRVPASGCSPEVAGFACSFKQPLSATLLKGKCLIFGECLLISDALQYSTYRATIRSRKHFISFICMYRASTMRHAISVLLQNEVGALTRMTGMFSSRGYNIESLNVAPTDDPTVSRVTIVVSGSDAAINQLNTQLAKLVDVVNIHDMTLGDHFERELAIIKMKLGTGGTAKALKLAKTFGAEVLDDAPVSFTLQLTGRVKEIDEFVAAAAEFAEISAVARSGTVAVSKGEVTLSSYDAYHHLSA
jgi:acetolactate synthase-1/3 small subunit